MSPRSEEFIEQARDRAQLAREALASGHREGAVSAAYYSMLYAARASLSESDEHARTHRGTWNLFRERYVVTDVFDDALFQLAQQVQTAREGADYEAATPSAEEAQSYVDGAVEFLAGVERMLAA
ncbi:MAG: HEPN domain-containing protein [Chloroflexota bacterium]